MAATTPTITAPRTDIIAAVARLRALSGLMRRAFDAELSATRADMAIQDDPDAPLELVQQAVSAKWDAQERYRRSAEEYRQAMDDFELTFITRPAWPIRRAS